MISKGSKLGAEFTYKKLYKNTPFVEIVSLANRPKHTHKSRESANKFENKVINKK